MQRRGQVLLQKLSSCRCELIQKTGSRLSSQGFPKQYHYSTAVRRAKNLTGLTTSQNVNRPWAGRHGSPPGSWRVESPHLSEVELENISERKSLSGETCLRLISFDLNQTRAKTILEIYVYYLLACSNLLEYRFLMAFPELTQFPDSFWRSEERYKDGRRTSKNLLSFTGHHDK